MRFATSDLPGHLNDEERASAWVEALGAQGGQFDMRSPDTRDFFGAVELRIIGDLQVGSAMATSVDVVRSPARIARDGDDRIMLILNRSNKLTRASQFDRTITLPPGGIALFDLALPCDCRTPQGGHVMHALVPRDLLSDLDIEALAATPLDGSSESGRLLHALIQSLLRHEVETPAIAEATTTYVATLVRDLVARGPASARPRAMNLSRLTRARALIAQRYSDPELSIDMAAAEIGVSARHLQMLFAAEGDTFSKVLLAARLDAAYLLLRSVGPEQPSIAQVAFECGFRDLSTFYRRFGGCYGQPPSRLRAAANG